MPTEIVGTMAVSGGQKQTALLMPGAYPAERITHQSVSVTTDGVKTYQALLNELIALIDTSKVSGRSYLKYKDFIYVPTYLTPTTIQFCCSSINSQKVSVIRANLKTGTSSYDNVLGTTYTNESTVVPTSGYTITFYY